MQMQLDIFKHKTSDKTPGVNFINILRTAFTLADPKAEKNTVKS